MKNLPSDFYKKLSKYSHATGAVLAGANILSAQTIFYYDVNLDVTLLAGGSYNINFNGNEFTLKHNDNGFSYSISLVPNSAGASWIGTGVGKAKALSKSYLISYDKSFDNSPR